MSTIKNFNDFASEQNSSASIGVNEGMMESKCMSEGMMEKCNEMYESMCEEMKAVHGDESEMTAESYMKECGMKMTEMMEGMKKVCESCMS